MLAPAIEGGLSRAAYGLRLDIVRRLAIPTLLIESGAASPTARRVTRRLHSISRRCRYRSVRGDPMKASSARDDAWALIAEHIVERGGTISPELFLAA
jgi:hypothetical protein